MDFLHNKTEVKFVEALATNESEINECLMSMEGKISGIPTSIFEIKGNLGKLESKMNFIFKLIQSTVNDLENKLLEAQNEIKRLEQKVESDKPLLRDKFKALQDELNSFKD